MDKREAVKKIRDISEQEYRFSPYPERHEIVRGVAHAHRRITELAKCLTVILESIFSDEE
jgi:hypothetical protein